MFKYKMNDDDIYFSELMKIKLYDEAWMRKYTWDDTGNYIRLPFRWMPIFIIRCIRFLSWMLYEL